MPQPGFKPRSSESRSCPLTLSPMPRKRTVSIFGNWKYIQMFITMVRFTYYRMCTHTQILCNAMTLLPHVSLMHGQNRFMGKVKIIHLARKFIFKFSMSFKSVVPKWCQAKVEMQQSNIKWEKYRQGRKFFKKQKHSIQRSTTLFLK